MLLTSFLRFLKTKHSKLCTNIFGSMYACSMIFKIKILKNM